MAADSSSSSPHYLPADDDGPFEVQQYIISVLTSPARPFHLDDVEAERIAKNFHGTGLDLKTATVGDLQAALGPIHGAQVFQEVDGHMSQLSSVTASVKKAAKSWGLDIFADRDQSESNPVSVAASRAASRAPSRAVSRRGSLTGISEPHDVHAPPEYMVGKNVSRSNSWDIKKELDKATGGHVTSHDVQDENAGLVHRRRSDHPDEA